MYTVLEGYLEDSHTETLVAYNGIEPTVLLLNIEVNYSVKKKQC